MPEVKKTKNPNKIRFVIPESNGHLIDEEEEDKQINKDAKPDEPDDQAELLNDIKVTEPSPVNEEFNRENDNENLVKVKETSLNRICRYMMHSSLFIFHKDLKFRRFLINLVVSPEMLQEYLTIKNEDKIGNNDQNTQNFEENEFDPDGENDIGLSDFDDSKDENFGKFTKTLKSSKSMEQKSGIFKSGQNRAQTMLLKDSEVKNLIKPPTKKTHPSKYFDTTIIILILLSSLLLIGKH